MARLVAAVIGVALILSVATAVLGILAAAATLYGMYWLGRWVWRGYRTRACVRAHERAELLARAEIQHRWYLAGDPRGTFGRYPPALAQNHHGSHVGPV
jgi:hypothetical protein